MSVVMGDARVAGNDLTESAQPTWEAAAFPAQRHKRSALLAVMWGPKDGGEGSEALRV